MMIMNLLILLIMISAISGVLSVLLKSFHIDKICRNAPKEKDLPDFIESINKKWHGGLVAIDLRESKSQELDQSKLAQEFAENTNIIDFILKDSSFPIKRFRFWADFKHDLSTFEYLDAFNQLVTSNVEVIKPSETIRKWITENKSDFNNNFIIHDNFCILLTEEARELTEFSLELKSIHRACNEYFSELKELENADPEVTELLDQRIWELQGKRDAQKELILEVLKSEYKESKAQSAFSSRAHDDDLTLETFRKLQE